VEPIVPSSWQDFYEATRVPAAVADDGLVFFTGHTGTLPDGSFPPGVESQLRATFHNLSLSLEQAGATWGDVLEMHSYHLGLRAQAGLMLEVASDFLTDPYPAWTAVGVAELFEEEALVEISCVARRRRR